MTKFRKSLLYSMADTYMGLPLQVIGTMLISRLLTPAELGVFAVAAVFASLASTFRDFGVAEYLIQEKELTASKLRAALSVNIMASWGIGVLLFVGAPFAAEFYRHPGVAEVMRLQALNFVLIPFGAVTMAYFRRELNFKPIFVASLLSNIATFSVATLSAYAGQAYMSLAWSSLAGVGVTVGTALYFRPKDFPRWPGWQGVAEVFHFGKFASAVYMLGQFGRGAPEMVIGRVETMADVAMFSRGGSLVELFNRLVLRAIVPVCQPYFAKSNREQGTVIEGYLRAISYLTGIGWPALLCMGLMAYPALQVLYGHQWVAATPIAELLCLVAAIELVHYLAKEALLAAGEARGGNALQIKMQGARLLGVLMVIPFGLIGACWGLLAAALLGLLLSQQAMRAMTGLQWRQLQDALRHSVLVTLGTGLPLGLLALLWPVGDANYLRWLGLAVPLACVSWLLALRVSGHPVWAEVRGLLGQLRARLGRAEGST